MKNFIIFMLLIILAMGMQLFALDFEELVQTRGRLENYIEHSSALESTAKELKSSLNQSHDSIQECDDRIAKSRNKICAKYLQQND